MNDAAAVLDLLKEVAVTASIDKNGKFCKVGFLKEKLSCVHDNPLIKLTCVSKEQEGDLSNFDDLNLKKDRFGFYVSQSNALRVVAVENYDDLLTKLQSYYHLKFAEEGDTLPTIDGKFIGRENLISEVKKWIEAYKKEKQEKGSYRIYAGAAGRGKTALAREIVVQAQNAPDEYGGGFPVYYFVPNVKNSRNVADAAKNLMRQITAYYPKIADDKEISADNFKNLIQDVSDKILKKQKNSPILLIVLDGVDQLEADWFDFCSELPAQVLCIATTRPNFSDFAPPEKIDVEKDSRYIDDAIAYVKYYNEQKKLGVEESVINGLRHENSLSFFTLNHNLRKLGAFDEASDDLEENDLTALRKDVKLWTRDNDVVISQTYDEYLARARRSGFSERQALKFLGYCAYVKRSMSIATLAWFIEENAGKRERRLDKEFSRLLYFARSFFKIPASRRPQTEVPLEFEHSDYVRFIIAKLSEDDGSGKKSDLYWNVRETLAKGCSRRRRTETPNRATEYALRYRIAHLLDLDLNEKQAQKRLIRALTDVSYFEKRCQVLRNFDDVVQDIENAKRSLALVYGESNTEEVELTFLPWISFLSHRSKFFLKYPYAISQEVANDFEGRYKGDLGEYFGLALEKNLNRALKKRSWLQKLWGRKNSFREKTEIIRWSSDGSFFVTANRRYAIKWTSAGTISDTFFYFGVQKEQFDVSLDGKTLVAFERVLGENVSICIWNLETGAKQTKKYAGSNVEKIFLSPDGSLLALIHKDDKTNTVSLWNVETIQRLFENSAEHRRPILCLVFSPNSSHFVTGDVHFVTGDVYGKICVWSVQDQKLCCKNDGTAHNSNRIVRLEFSKDGKKFASGDSSGRVCLWNLDDGDAKVPTMEPTSVFEEHKEEITGLAFSEDSHLVACDKNGKICFWKVNSKKLLKSPKGDSEGTLSFLHDNRLIFGGTTGTISLWTNSGKRVDESHLYNARIRGLVCAPSEASFVSIGDDDGIRLWNVEEEKLMSKVLIQYEGSLAISDLKYSPDDKYLAVYDGTIKIIDLANGCLTDELKVDSNAPQFFFLTKKTILVIEKERRRLWDVVLHKELLVVPKENDEVTDIRFSPDLKRYVRTRAGETYLRDVKSAYSQPDDKGLELTPKHDGRRITCLQFSQDGRRLLSGDYKGRACSWDACTNELIFQCELEEPIRTLSFVQERIRVQLSTNEVVELDADDGSIIRRRLLFKDHVLQLDLDGVSETPIAPLWFNDEIGTISRIQTSDGTIRYVVQDIDDGDKTYYGVYKLNNPRDRTEPIRL